MKRVVMLSWWKDDYGRQLCERIAHLRSKTYPNLRFLWIVGNSEDFTEAILRREAAYDSRIDVVRFDSAITSNEPNPRAQRLSECLTAGLRCIRDEDEVAVIHESDLQTPANIVERLLASGKDIIAGWPTLTAYGSTIFYDSWAYRADGGQRFNNYYPHHHVYKPNQIFEVESVGSCWAFPAQAARNLTIERWCCVELCDRLREMGYRVWVDPTIEVVQPESLWTSVVNPGH